MLFAADVPQQTPLLSWASHADTASIRGKGENCGVQFPMKEMKPWRGSTTTLSSYWRYPQLSQLQSDRVGVCRSEVKSMVYTPYQKSYNLPELKINQSQFSICSPFPEGGKCVSFLPF